MKLNIGAGNVPLNGYTPIDRKFGSEAYPLNYPDESVEEIRASHILEHFDWATVPKVLAEWRRVLKPGGILKIAVPNMEYVKDHLNDKLALMYVMGGQDDENDFHKSAYTANSLQKLMFDAGFRDFESWKSEIRDCASLPVSLNLMGKKLAEPTPVVEEVEDVRTKIAAVISMPRLCFSDFMYSAVQSLAPFGIQMTRVTGAFWGQCLERGMEVHVDDGTEWLLTLDYDTVFDQNTVKELCYLMVEHPEADAIAPIQVHREKDYALMALENEKGERVTSIPAADLNKPLLRASWAHFGLTMFRVEALKKMAHPWFKGEPNKEGRWGEGRTDDDIYFWHKWREAGNTLFVAPKVRVGHCQLMISWPDTDFKPIHQFPSVYHKSGPPQLSPLPAARTGVGAPQGGKREVAA